MCEFRFLSISTEPRSSNVITMTKLFSFPFVTFFNKTFAVFTFCDGEFILHSKFSTKKYLKYRNLYAST